MPRSPDFSEKVVRLLAERAGQRCSNPNCGAPTSGPSDDGSGDSTTLGKACHITAARRSGPRYDSSLTDKARSHQDNGIWLCATCADRIDKKENEKNFPVELLRVWKEFHESVTGTDHASIENRRRYPLRQLTINNYAGVRGETTITFGRLTLVLGTNKLSHTIAELLLAFSDRVSFEQTRQPVDASSSEFAHIPITDDAQVGITVKHPLRTFTKRGKLKLKCADGHELIIATQRGGAEFSVDGVAVPVYSSPIKTIALRKFVIDYDSEVSASASIEQQLASHLGISTNELRSCIEGSPADDSIFNYDYDFDRKGRLVVRRPSETTYQTVASLSCGELSRLILDTAIRVARHTARIKPCVLLLDQALTSMDAKGWARLFSWIEDKKPPFQTVVDLYLYPSMGDTKRALCYEAQGEDMNVSSFAIKP